MRHFLFLAFLAAGLSFAVAEDKSPYPNELEGYRFFQTARWNSLTPLVSTMADVRKTLGEPAEAKDIAHYGEPYPGDEAAGQPILLYAVDDDWEMIVYFVKSDLSSPKELRAKVPDTLYQIALIPNRAISFKEVVLPAAFRKRKVTAADAAWDEYGDGSGLVYQIYTCRTMHGKREPGDLNRINYGPSEEAVRKIVEPADK